MSGSVKVIQIESGFFGKKVLVEAVTHCESYWGSVLGTRKFYMQRGERRRISMSSGTVLFREGETVPFEDICFQRTLFQFSWDWT